MLSSGQTSHRAFAALPCAHGEVQEYLCSVLPFLTPVTRITPSEGVSACYLQLLGTCHRNWLCLLLAYMPLAWYSLPYTTPGNNRLIMWASASGTERC